MYTKAEASAVKQKFWTSFGKYMSPVPSANNEKINWVNYKTGIKGIFFKMDADKNAAYISIEISLPNIELQNLYVQTFRNFAKQFEEIVGLEWDLYGAANDDDARYTYVFRSAINGVNIFKESDWPTIIGFLKRNIIALDKFWDLYKPAFELLM
jgi:hypothetical protein